MKGFTLLFLVAIGADTLVSLTGIPIPGSIIGMIGLVIWFTLTGNVNQEIQDASTHLLKYLALLLVPVGVAVVNLVGSVNSSLLSMVAISVIALFISVGTTVFVALTAKRIFKRRNTIPSQITPFIKR